MTEAGGGLQQEILEGRVEGDRGRWRVTTGDIGGKGGG